MTWAIGRMLGGMTIIFIVCYISYMLSAVGVYWLLKIPSDMYGPPAKLTWSQAHGPNAVFFAWIGILLASWTGRSWWVLAHERKLK